MKSTSISTVLNFDFSSLQMESFTFMSGLAFTSYSCVPSHQVRFERMFFPAGPQIRTAV